MDEMQAQIDLKSEQIRKQCDEVLSLIGDQGLQQVANLQNSPSGSAGHELRQASIGIQ